MGTDIHCWVEKRVDDTLGSLKGKWALVHLQKDDAGFDTYVNEPGKRNYYETRDGPNAEARWAMRKNQWDMGRCYDLFAILADIRNGRGFAGIRTGDGFEPILCVEIDGELSHRRGWPTDASPEVTAHAAEHIDHSPSWLTLEELDKYDWDNQFVKKCGVISLKAYQERLAKGEKGSPASYSGWISGPNIEVVAADKADELLRLKELPSGKITHVQVEWVESYADTVSYFRKGHLDSLNAIAKREGVTPGDLRLVFYFDS